jgi:poly(3-hydroxybutyrate) depolymerase
MRITPWLALLGFLLIATPLLTAAERVHSLTFKGVERTFRVFVRDAAAGAERLLGKATMNIDANDIIWEFFSRHTLQKG